MNGGGNQMNARGPDLAMVLTAMAGIFALVSVSCHDAQQPAARVQVNSARPHRVATEKGSMRADSEANRAISGLVTSILDPRLKSLLRAADTWRRSQGPERRVIDQVYLVPDLASFLDVIATWDERSFFPILIDDPACTLAFVRAFRPARVVRIVVGNGTGKAPAERSVATTDRNALWTAAQNAVARAWTGESVPDGRLPPAHRVPSNLGPTPPGLVLSNPESPMLAGAVALAAGRFQPLVRLEPITRDADSEESPVGSRVKSFRDVLALAEARRFAHLIEATASTITGTFNGLGDHCDFLTLAGDWPYRYLNNTEGGGVNGEHALDDLVGRLLETDEVGLAQSRSRWAFTGRLLGNPATSVYRAMCSLFLRPDSALLWNTYNGGRNWSDYRMTEAARTLGLLWPRSMPPVHRSGVDASLAAWHDMFDPVNRFGWIMVNSSGAPRQFSIPGGSGIPADLPRGRPTAVSIIHSFSAADPVDPSTVAGRWLENGAYVYYGAMNEPYLHSFRCPKLVAELAAVEIPLSAVLRQGEHEPFGRPWRLVYLGDPLFRFRQDSNGARQNRIAPRVGEIAIAIRGDWTSQEITTRAQPLDHRADESTTLKWCLTAAIRGLCQNDVSAPAVNASVQIREEPVDWQSILLKINREKLDPLLKPFLDEVVADTLLNAGNQERLLDWLLRIPPAECSPRDDRTIETVAMSRLANLAGGQSITPALDLWDELIRRPWPNVQAFPGQLTQRLGALVNANPRPARELYRQRLVQAKTFLSLNPPRSLCVDFINDELKRIEAAP
jgi:hypothetical protein